MKSRTTGSSSPAQASTAVKPRIDIHSSASALLTPSLQRRLDAAAFAAIEAGVARGIDIGELFATGFESYEEDYQAVTLRVVVDADDTDAAAFWSELAERVYQQGVSMTDSSVHEPTDLAVEVDWRV